MPVYANWQLRTDLETVGSRFESEVGHQNMGRKWAVGWVRFPLVPSRGYAGAVPRTTGSVRFRHDPPRRVGSVFPATEVT